MKLNGYTGTIQPGHSWLYQHGKTAYRILLRRNASEAERYAAQELTALFAMAGVRIETVAEGDASVLPGSRLIAIGDTGFFRALELQMTQKTFKFDGFLIETVGNVHIIKGVNDTGTCFGVYGFAEYAMEWRYYCPDEQRIAKQARDKVFHIRDIPTFFSRYAYSYYTAKNPDHGFRLRVNGQFSRRETRHGEGTPWNRLHDQSLAVQIMDYKKYRADHPDWYYLSPENERKPAPGGTPQICFSKAMQPDAEGGFFDTFMRNLLEEYIIPQPGKPYAMLGISDNRDFCNCPACREAVAKYSQSGHNMRFVNQVADAVEAWRRQHAPEREIFLITFAYLSSFEPPVVWNGEEPVPLDPSVVARDNVIVRLAPIDAKYCCDLLDETENAESRRSIRGWSAVAKHLSVWDYRSDFGTQIFPYPTTLTAQANHDIYMKYGMVDVFNQGQTFAGGTAFQKMDDFARARMHWNGKEHYDSLTEEFRKAYYQEAEPAVTEYLQLLERSYGVWKQRGWTERINNRAAIRKHYYTVEEMYRQKEVLDQALEAARAIPEPERAEKILHRVEELTLFYKFVLVICFPLEIPKEEAMRLIAELRVLASRCGMEDYLRKESTVGDWLAEAEQIVLGKLPESERTYKLKRPEDGPF